MADDTLRTRAEPREPIDQADHHKHMDYVQAVIARLASDSLLMKGWALTVSAAVLSYAVVHLDWRVALVGFVPALAFWYLDSYFLHRETLFRRLFDDVASGKVRNFSLSYRDYLPRVSRVQVFFSETLRWFYGFIVAVTVLVLIAAVYASLSKPSGDRPGRHLPPAHSKAS